MDHQKTVQLSFVVSAMLISFGATAERSSLTSLSDQWHKVAAETSLMARDQVSVRSSRDSCGTPLRQIRQCGDVLAKYETLCVLGKDSALANEPSFEASCELLATEMRSCDFRLEDLSNDVSIPSVHEITSSPGGELLEPFGMWMGMNGCEARNSIVEKGLFEIRPCQFRTPARLKNGDLSFRVIQLFTDESVELLDANRLKRQRLNALFTKTRPKDCDGAVSGIEYRHSVDEPAEVEVSQFVEHLSSQFGAPADCAELDATRAVCNWSSIPVSDAMASAALQVNSRNGRQRLVQLGLRGRPLASAEYEVEADPVGQQDLPPVQNKIVARPSKSIESAAKAALAEISITLDKTTFKPGEQIEIRLSDLPGSSTDWLTVIGADEAETKWGQWKYTNGSGSGTWTFAAPSKPGTYEVRVYFDYPRGGFDVKARRTLEVIR